MGRFLVPSRVLSVTMRAVIVKDALPGSHRVRLICVRIGLVAILRRHFVQPARHCERGKNRERR